MPCDTYTTGANSTARHHAVEVQRAVSVDGRPGHHTSCWVKQTEVCMSQPPAAASSLAVQAQTCQSTLGPPSAAAACCCLLLLLLLLLLLDNCC
jgi:hypothetical protein